MQIHEITYSRVNESILKGVTNAIKRAPAVAGAVGVVAAARVHEQLHRLLQLLRALDALVAAVHIVRDHALHHDAAHGHARIERREGILEDVLDLTLEAAPLGGVHRREIAALTGVAPYNRDSGTLRGKRRIRGGRAHSRTALYLTAMVATRYNPHIKRFYERLLATGKHKKVALIACIRKIVTALNAMLRDNTPWNAATT